VPNDACLLVCLNPIKVAVVKNGGAASFVVFLYFSFTEGSTCFCPFVAVGVQQETKTSVEVALTSF
jgi:hypothetical protein